jgi:putative oxygen-independent coproporphyrinogen III oxidase
VVVSLYFHIPFCTKKCPYCHFYVLPDNASLKALFLEGLKREWKQNLPLLKDKEIASVYFGGGTPTLLHPKEIEWILSQVKDLSLSPSCEITLETNPESCSNMNEWAAIGINRVSIGVQSLDDSSLFHLGRNHSARTAKEAILTTFQAGIENISIDLMYDLPHQTLDSWEKTLQEIQQLPIQHLSLYNLTIEPNTPFFKRQKSLLSHLPSPDESLELLNRAITSLESIGLKRYEISAFARPSFTSKHNTGYWTARPFLGFGPSAFSYWEGRRFRNIPHLKKYLNELENDLSPVDFEEKLPYPDNLHELLSIRLRLLEGVDLIDFQNSHGDLPEKTKQILTSLEKKGWLHCHLNQLKLTEEGLLFYDSVAETLI